jgi:RimJ/RimL family protein N-acetyltransferase
MTVDTKFGKEAVMETERLLLRKLKPQDLDSLVDVYGDPLAMRYFEKVYTRDEIRERFLNRNLARYDDPGYGMYAVERKRDGEFLGLAGPNLEEVDGERYIEVGYSFKPAAWGNGYATEAAAACVQYVFERLGAQRAVSFIDPQNQTSQRVAQRNGLRPEKQIQWHGKLHEVWVKDREGTHG